MKNPLPALLLCACAAASASAASAQVSTAAITFQPGYWERGYAWGGNVVSANYTLMLRVASLAKASAEVDKRMTRAGGSLTSLNNNGIWGGEGNPQRLKSKTMSFSLPDAKAEAAAKSLFTLGEIQQYNSTRQPASGGQLDEIKQKLKLVEDELSANAKALEKMPVSTYFLTQQRQRLTQARDSYEAGKNKAMINITLIEAPELR